MTPHLALLMFVQWVDLRTHFMSDTDYLETLDLLAEECSSRKKAKEAETKSDDS